MFSSVAPNTAAAAAGEAAREGRERGMREDMHRNTERGEERGRQRGRGGERVEEGKGFLPPPLRASRSAFGGVSPGGWWNCRRDVGGGSWFCE